MKNLIKRMRHFLGLSSKKEGTSIHWIKLQKNLLKEHGLFLRLKALTRKLFKKIANISIGYIRARPMLRMKLHNYVVRIGQAERLREIYYRIQFSTVRTLPLTYQDWLTTFDTPSSEIIHQLESDNLNRSSVSVIAYFDESSEQYAEELAMRLLECVAQDWKALFVFNSNCKLDGVQRIGCADKRISFNHEKFGTVEDLVIFIQGGALPRMHALNIFTNVLHSNPNALFAYSDEDQLNLKDASLSNPWFKPQFSPILAAQGVLLGRMFAFRSRIFSQKLFLDQLSKGDINPSLELINYAIQEGEHRVLHIPHVLFHNALPPLPLIEKKYSLPENLPVISIIIPTKDRWDLLGPCLESIRSSDWPISLLEIIIVDNGSTDSKTIKMLTEFEEAKTIKIIRDTKEFNWSRLNNIAAIESSGEVLVFLNNDTKVLDHTWLKKLTTYALMPNVGAVGCKLLYPDETVQHGGVIAGIQGVAGHAHLFLQKNDGGYRNLANITHEVLAVTGACLAVARYNFEKAGGFNEDFRVAFNDIVFCFSLHALGKRNIYIPDPLLIHYESKSRGYDDTSEKLALLRAEARKAWALYPSLMRNDPFYSPNLSLSSPYELAFVPRRRALWDKKNIRSPRVIMFSSTHAIGHGVAVVVALQAEALLKHGYEVIIAGPRSSNDFPYKGCERVELHDPMSASILAVARSVDLIVAHTPPFFSVARWVGNHSPVLSYDYGEPPPEWFPDAEARRALLVEKDQVLAMTTNVFAISDAIAVESRTPVKGVIPLGNSHLGQWDKNTKLRRERVRMERGWSDCFVVLNVCRFHGGERLYKGVDVYADVRDTLSTTNPELTKRVIFVLCGKGASEDVKTMTERGLVVVANVSDEEMTDLYSAADAYANFSKWEGYNLGIGQALAMGLPTIASDILAHRAFGIMVTNNVQEVVEWVTKTMEMSGVRTPMIWDWNISLSKLINEVDTICKNP